ncbi:MAG: hypothetical protein IT237_00925 [Bacteroidia bacterium]|nr:hypothetical protein [Bacteroidia bacterium]
MKRINSYKLCNHLGNVLTVVSDRKLAVDNNSDNIVDYYLPDIISATDYYSHHQAMPGRTFNRNAYRYGGSNGQEKDDEIAQGIYTAEYWEYDSRLGRRWNMDPVPVPGISDYSCFNNNPILNVDPNGDVVKVHGNVFQKIKFWATYAFSGKNSQFRQNVDFQRSHKIDNIDQFYHYKFNKGHTNDLLAASNSMVNADPNYDPNDPSPSQNHFSSKFGNDLRETKKDFGVGEGAGETTSPQEVTTKRSYSRGRIILKFSSNNDTGDPVSGGDVVTITQGSTVILPPTTMPFGEGITVNRVINFNNININRRAIKVTVTNQDGGSPGAFYLKVKIRGRK